MNEQCSSWCETSALKLKAGTTVQCTNKSFAQAAADAFPDILGGLVGGLGGLLGGFEKILMWIAIGIVILVVGYVIIKEGIHYIGSKGDVAAVSSAAPAYTAPAAPAMASPTAIMKAAFRKGK